MPLQSISAGQLRKRISIESFTTTKNSYGEDVRTYALFVGSWARIESLVGRELELAKAIVETVSHKITMRYQPGIDSTMRVKFAAADSGAPTDRYFGIGGIVNPEEQNIALVLYCTEEVNQ